MEVEAYVVVVMVYFDVSRELSLEAKEFFVR